MNFYTKIQMVPEISDEEIEEMLEDMSPVVFDEETGLHVVDVEGVNRRKTAYTWAPTIKRPARLAWGNGMSGTIMTFHKFGAPALFKPSLAEALACIRAFVPDAWPSIKYFWLDARDLDRSNVLGSVHYCRCHLFTAYDEFPEE